MLKRIIIQQTTKTRFFGSVSNKIPATPTSQSSQSSQTPTEQSPNHSTIWSSSQNPKELATTGPRFEQTNWDLQPNPLSAQELIANVPVKMVHSRKVACDGGGGSLGHPKVYLNLDSNSPVSCGYCGLRFQQDHSHHH